MCVCARVFSTSVFLRMYVPCACETRFITGLSRLLRNRLARALRRRSYNIECTHRGVMPLLVNRVARTQNPHRVSFLPVLYSREIAQWRFGGLLANESSTLVLHPCRPRRFRIASTRPPARAWLCEREQWLSNSNDDYRERSRCVPKANICILICAERWERQRQL